jgi:hypothetical protein
MKVTVKQYYTGFRSLWGLVAGAFFVPPLLNVVIRIFSPPFAAYLYPPLGHVQPIAIAGTVIFLLLITVVVFVSCGSAQRFRPVVPIILAGSFLLGMCFFIGLYGSYVRRAPIPAVNVEIPLSVGYDRTEFAKQQYSEKTDAEMLHDWGSSEEEIQKLWTKRSMAIVRGSLWLSYTLTLACVLAVISIVVYQHAAEESPDESTRAREHQAAPDAVHESGTAGP